MIVPSYLDLIREMVRLQKQGVPRWVAARGVLDKYRLRYLPSASHDKMHIPRAPGLNAILQLYGLPPTKAGYVRAMFWPYAPTFPLDTDVVNAIPDAPGAVPARLKDVLFGRFAFVDVANVASLEEMIRFLDGALLHRQRRVCTARGRGHLWLQFRTLTFARGPEFYCGFCLVVKLAGFRGWPTSPQIDDK